MESCDLDPATFQKESFLMGNYILWFLKAKNTHIGNLRKGGLAHTSFGLISPTTLFD
jgi:hypothetical protein